MKSTSFSVLWAACAIATSAVSIGAVAQNETALYQEEVIVKGQYLYNDQINALKSPTPILDVPQSLSIITANMISKQGFTALGDIINYTSGVNNSQGEGHRDSIVFRGIRSTADYYIDGSRDDVQYYRPLYNIEQVEILRGPNALLFGRGGTGGILNRVTKKGELNNTFMGYQVTVDSFGGYNVQLDGNSAIDTDAALRINARYETLENHRDFFDGERVGINPALKVKLDDATVLDLSYEYINHQRFIDRGIPTGTDGRPVSELDNVVFGDPKLNNTELTANIARAMLQHDFSTNLKGNVSAFYADYDKLYENFYASGYDEANSPNEVTLDGYIDTTQREHMILAGNLVGQFSTGNFEHTVIAGVEYIETSSDQDRFNAFWDTTQDDNEIFNIQRPLNLRNGGVGVNALGQVTQNDYSIDINDDTRVDLETQSVFIQDEIALSEHFDVVLGARYDSFDIDVFNAVADERRSRRDEEISPRAGLIFKPAGNISIYASYSETFLPRSGEQYANIKGEADQLAPDEFANREVGLKWDFANGIRLTAAYFKNEQTRADRDNETGEAFEVRGLKVDGFELQIEGQISDVLSLRGGYSYLDGETASGKEPRELPRNSAFLWSNYQLTDKLGLGLGVTYQDKSLIKDGSNAFLPSYTRVDAAMYYQLTEKLRLQLNVENLFDEEYYPNSHSTHQATVGEPFNARIALIGRF